MKPGHLTALMILALTLPGGALQAAEGNDGAGLEGMVLQVPGSDAPIADEDILVPHMPVPENIGMVRNLHAPPGILGNIAPLADARTRVPSHFMARSPENIRQNPDAIRSNYKGAILAGKDLDCVVFLNRNGCRNLQKDPGSNGTKTRNQPRTNGSLG
jgi:hypothetical protein